MDTYACTSGVQAHKSTERQTSGIFLYRMFHWFHAYATLGNKGHLKKLAHWVHEISIDIQADRLAILDLEQT